MARLDLPWATSRATSRSRAVSPPKCCCRARRGESGGDGWAQGVPGGTRDEASELKRQVVSYHAGGYHRHFQSGYNLKYGIDIVPRIGPIVHTHARAGTTASTVIDSLIFSTEDQTVSAIGESMSFTSLPQFAQAAHSEKIQIHLAALLMRRKLDVTVT